MSSVQESFNRIAVLKVFQTVVSAAATGALSLSQVDQVGTAFPSVQADGSPGYRIRFRVDKVVEVTPNPTSIFIHNLGPDSRALFTPNAVLVLEAGYAQSSEVIFRGNISRVRTRKEGVDYVTQIEAADGLFAVQNSKIDQSFRQAVSAQSVIDTLVGALGTGGVERGQVSVPRPDVYSQGVVLSGRAVEQLRRVCDRSDLQFSIQDGKVMILPIGASNGTPAFVISSDTGMVGIPEKRDVGISFRALLNPKLMPFQPVILVSRFINGAFTAAKVIHTGDSAGGPWHSEVEAS